MKQLVRSAGMAALSLLAASCEEPPPPPEPDPAPVDQRSEIETLLAGVRTAAGMPVLQRLEACGATIRWDYAQLETTPVDLPQLGMKAGDMSIELYFDLPPVPGDRPESAMYYHELRARWIGRPGRLIADSNWSRKLTEQRRPLGSPVWLDC